MTKKALSSLRLPPKSSFTSSKLRFWGLRKPKNSSFIQSSTKEAIPFYFRDSLFYIAKVVH